MKANSIHCIRVTYRVLRLLYYSDWVYPEELRITCMDWSALVKWATGVFVVRRVAGHHNTITATMGSVEATVLIWCKIKYENVKIKIMSGPWFRAVDRGWVYSKFNVCTAVVTDAMHMIWRIFCPKDEIFTNISIRYQYFLCMICVMAQDRLSLVATDADPLAYWHCVSNTRAKSKLMRKCEIQCHFNILIKKSPLLPQMTKLLFVGIYSRDGHSRKYRGLLKVNGSYISRDGFAADVSELELTQKEADTRIILHCIYSMQNLQTTLIPVNANGTGVTVLCTCKAAMLLSVLQELKMGTEHDKHLPIPYIAQALGQSQCELMPFTYVICRDPANHPYFTGNITWFTSSTMVRFSCSTAWICNIQGKRGCWIMADWLQLCV